MGLLAATQSLVQLELGRRFVRVQRPSVDRLVSDIIRMTGAALLLPLLTLLLLLLLQCRVCCQHLFIVT